MICPSCGTPIATSGEIDKRTARWRIRIRLYRPEFDEPVADTDPELRPDNPLGHAVLQGLPAVADDLATIAGAFHCDAQLVGLEPATLSNKLKSLRTTLTRRGTGDAVWRVAYRTSDGREWQARVDVTREAES